MKSLGTVGLLSLSLTNSSHTHLLVMDSYNSMSKSRAPLEGNGESLGVTRPECSLYCNMR